MLDLNQMALFVQVVQAGSFVHAAERLDTSKAVVSRLVLELEESLSTRLLHRTTRRVRCSHEICRPWKSNVLPLLLFDGMRKVLTWPSSSSQRICRLFGMSLHSRYRPTPFHAGPSAHNIFLL